ncbi:glycosyltransferase family 2 protein [Alcanivorax sp.]|uniref:glycosyltransferase family 2 protein n=1 Tax=Alcanivorax sp. TaxID=1872427 RepID=UPI002584C244|nr:glycosyltransferase family 2 protein [Alcanivorax sp.]
MAEIVRSLVIPVYRNEDNLPELLSFLRKLNGKIDGLEIVFVIDGSPDGCFDRLANELPCQPYPSQLILLSRNFGAFAAIRRGLEEARGSYFAVMAADLQEPEHLVIDFFKLLDAGNVDVVMGKRTDRDDPWLSALLSGVFWSMYRRFVIPDVPDGGVDVFACNEKVRDALMRLEEINSSLIGQLFWVGFRREFVAYKRQGRKAGKSAWNFRRKLRYMLDSVFSFSDLPILMFLWIGGVGILSSVMISLIVIVARLMSLISIPGYTPIVLSIYFMGSLLLLGQGLIGSYVWRCNENTKRRPITLVSIRKTFMPEDEV